MPRYTRLLLPLAAAIAGLLPVAAHASAATTVLLQPVADTYVNAGYPAENYGTADNLYLLLGTPPTRSRLLFGFNLSSIPTGSHIESATLTPILRTTASGTTITLFVSLASSAWDETAVTWDTQPTTTSTLPDITVSRLVPQELPVTALVQAMVDAPGTYSGIEIASRETGNAFTWGYGARESSQPALLSVSYVPLVDTLPPTVSARAVENIGLTSADAVLTTNEEATATVEFGLDATYGRSIAESAATLNHRVTLFPLASNSTYHYRVRVRDAAGNETVTTDATFATLASSGGLPAGTLVKIADDHNPATQIDSAVYYVGSDGKRHAFPTAKIYGSWYADFSSVQIVTIAQMAALPLGANVRYKPGVRLVKFTTVPTVYAVSAGGSLRAIGSEAVAAALYGAQWNTMVDDLSDVLFGNYSFGADVVSATDYDPVAERAGTTTIDQEQGR